MYSRGMRSTTGHIPGVLPGVYQPDGPPARAGLTGVPIGHTLGHTLVDIADDYATLIAEESS